MMKTVTDSDKIILHTVESYLMSNHHSMVNVSPGEKLTMETQARNWLYSEIVNRVPRVASYIMSADMETDTVAQGLFTALCHHSMDPIFINYLMNHLARANNAEENGIVGALLTQILNKQVETRTASATIDKSAKKNDKGGDKNTTPPANEPIKIPEIEHLESAVKVLLKTIIDVVQTRCPGLTEPAAMAISACLAMNNADTIPQIIASDLPVTAEIFNILSRPDQIVYTALRLEKDEYLKPTQNQQEFINSLRRWVYKKLNEREPTEMYQYLVAVYGSVKPETDKYLLQIKDCGTQFSNLLTVAKTIINKK